MARSRSDFDQHPYGESVGALIREFANLPGIGRKSAERLAHFILNCPREEALGLARAIQSVKDSVRHCQKCFNLTEGELCSICSDVRRDSHKICIVEQARDVVTLEASGVYTGLYHVLGGRLSPLEGIGPEQLTLDALIKRIRRDGVEEVIMATNPTLEGDGTALYISNLLADESVQITRLARGIASGSVLEFANKEMLADALKGRQQF